MDENKQYISFLQWNVFWQGLQPSNHNGKWYQMLCPFDGQSGLTACGKRIFEKIKKWSEIHNDKPYFVTLQEVWHDEETGNTDDAEFVSHLVTLGIGVVHASFRSPGSTTTLNLLTLFNHEFHHPVFYGFKEKWKHSPNRGDHYYYAMNPEPQHGGGMVMKKSGRPFVAVPFRLRTKIASKPLHLPWLIVNVHAPHGPSVEQTLGDIEKQLRDFFDMGGGPLSGNGRFAICVAGDFNVGHPKKTTQNFLGCKSTHNYQAREPTCCFGEHTARYDGSQMRHRGGTEGNSTFDQIWIFASPCLQGIFVDAPRSIKGLEWGWGTDAEKDFHSDHRAVEALVSVKPQT